MGSNSTKALWVSFIILFNSSVNASISPKNRVISVRGDTILTALLTTDGELYFQSSQDGGDIWSNSVSAFNFGATIDFPFANPQVLVGGENNAYGGVAFHSSVGVSQATSNFTMYKLPNPTFIDPLYLPILDPNMHLGLGFLPNVTSFLVLVPDDAYENSSDHALNLYVFTESGEGMGQGGNTSNSIRTRGSTAPCFLLMGPDMSDDDPVVAVTVPPLGDGTPYASVDFQFSNIKQLWEPQTGTQETIPGFSGTQISNSNRIELVSFEDASSGSLIWLSNGIIKSVFYDAFSFNPSKWNNLVLLSAGDSAMAFNLMGGIHLNNSSGKMEVLCTTNRGELVLAHGSLGDGLHEKSFVQKIPNINQKLSNVNQVSLSNVRGVYGWWLVLAHNESGEKGLYLLKGDPTSGTIVDGFRIAHNFNTLSDHNIAMAVGADESSSNVFAIFDVTSTSTTFNEDPNFNPSGLQGSGSYVCKVEGGDLVSGKITLQRLPDN